jgi:SAM-dependent methyltransferase
MGFYQRRILPWLITWAMQNEDLTPYRRRVLAPATGRLLEIGVGSGLNLPLYPPEVTDIVAIDPSVELLMRARRVAGELRRSIEFVQASAEAVPAPDQVFDTVVTTWTLCSVPDARKTLAEIRRVLKPGGQLCFVEHGLAPQAGVQKWQHRIDPFWNHVSCHLDLPIDRLIQLAGFRLSDFRVGYLPRGPKIMTYLYEGRATPSEDLTRR